MLRAIQNAIRLHEAYKPKILREGKEMLGSNKLVGAAGLARALETSVGFTNLVWIDKDHELVPSPMQTKDALDGVGGRWHREKAERRTKSMDQPAETNEDGDAYKLHDLKGRGSRSDVMGSVEVSLARDAATGIGIGSLLKEILDSIDTVAGSQPEAALSMAAEVLRLVALLRSEPDAGIRAGILYAWGRGDRYRGGLDPKAIAGTLGVGVKTIRRREADGRLRLVAAGLRDPEENRSD
jgi:hypothetical protein